MRKLTPEERRTKNRESMRKWRKANPEQYKAMSQKHARNRRLNEPADMKAQKRRHYELHKADILTKMKAYRKAHPEQRRMIAKKYRDTHREHVRQYRHRKRLKDTYGLTPEAVEALFQSQGNRCAICRRERSEFKQICVDHCHDTGLVRGILCHRCNIGLSHFKDNADLLHSAINYLSRSRMTLTKSHSPRRDGDER